MQLNYKKIIHQDETIEIKSPQVKKYYGDSMHIITNNNSVIYLSDNFLHELNPRDSNFSSHLEDSLKSEDLPFEKCIDKLLDIRSRIDEIIKQLS